SDPRSPARVQGRDDSIVFQIPNPLNKVQMISVPTDLPEITIPVRIDGTLEQGYAGTQPKVQLTNAGDVNYGLHISGGDSVVDGVMIPGFDQVGILLDGEGHSEVYDCYLGTDGSTALGNAAGVFLLSSWNQIGEPGKGNVISGNSGAGVYVSSQGMVIAT